MAADIWERGRRARFLPSADGVFIFREDRGSDLRTHGFSPLTFPPLSVLGLVILVMILTSS